MENNITFFKFNGLVDILNNLGFRHSSGYKYNDKDFEDGRGFIINIQDKTYSYAFIYNDKVKTKDEILEIINNIEYEFK